MSAGGEDVEEEDGGGERGGEANSMRDWNLVFGVEGCDGSQAKAEGSSMIADVVVVRDSCCDREMRDAIWKLSRHHWMRRLRSEVEPVRIGGLLWDRCDEGIQKCRCV